MELCPKCQLELKIREGKPKVINDDTPDKVTEVYIIQELYCPNPQCLDTKDKDGNALIVGEIKHRIL